MSAVSHRYGYQAVNNALLILVAVIAILTGSFAAEAQISGGSGTEAAAYDRCLSQARSAPQDAYETALTWFERGGGLPARHCAAVALLWLGAHDEAAARLETLAGAVPDRRGDLRIALLAQAAQAWVMSGRLERAERLQGLAIDARPDDPQLRGDRAVTRLSLKHYWEAVDDLDVALTLSPEDTELLLYRAVAYRRLGVADLAVDDVARALALEPDNPTAWLERGVLDQLAGDADAARRAWLKVLDLTVSGRIADAARARLEALDVTR
jgi:tetratricopeptide (TPR) repeat protein